MTENALTTAPSKRKNTDTLPRLDLKSPDATRRTIGRLIRRYAAGKTDEALYKGVLYGLQSYLSWFKFERDLEIEKRLEELEARL